MTPTEAAALLTCAAAFDNRKPDADTAHAWSLVLDGLSFVDCRTAIVNHYRKTTEWLMPAHVTDGVKAIRRERLLKFGPLEPPPELDPDDDAAWFAWLSAATTAVADGAPLPSVSNYAQLEQREMPDLNNVVRRVPSARVIAKSSDPDYAAKKAAARAELAAMTPAPTPEEVRMTTNTLPEPKPLAERVAELPRDEHMEAIRAELREVRAMGGASADSDDEKGSAA